MQGVAWLGFPKSTKEPLGVPRSQQMSFCPVCTVGSAHPSCITYLEKGKIDFPSQRGRGMGEMCSLLWQLVTLRNILGKVCSPVTDTVKWRRFQRNQWAPFINLSISFLSVCIFLTDVRSQSQALLELLAPLHSQSRSQPPAF